MANRDKLCLEPGVDWEQGFCEGLVSSRAFVPLLSRDAINHSDKDWQNFSKLTADSKCDNVFLEHRLAVELHELGMIEKMFPIFIGDVDFTTDEYTNYFGSGCHPKLPNVSVAAVEEKLRHHMESQALGTPLVPDRTVLSVVTAITSCQGAFIQGESNATFQAAADSIANMVVEVEVEAVTLPASAPAVAAATIDGLPSTTSLSPRPGTGAAGTTHNPGLDPGLSPRGGTHAHKALLDAERSAGRAKDETITALQERVSALIQWHLHYILSCDSANCLRCTLLLYKANYFQYTPSSYSSPNTPSHSNLNTPSHT